MGVKFIPAFSSLFVFISMLAIVSTTAWIPLTTNSAVADIFSLIQIWLPFNLITVLNYIFTIIALYYSFKLFRTAWSFVADVTGRY